MAQALGAKLLTTNGEQIEPGGGSLASLNTIDLSDLDPRIPETETVVACDVNNPLTGKEGASHVYGPQKGATAEMIEVLDANLGHYDSILQRDLGKFVNTVPGAGARRWVRGWLDGFPECIPEIGHRNCHRGSPIEQTVSGCRSRNHR